MKFENLYKKYAKKGKIQFVATKGRGGQVLAVADDYRQLEEKIKDKKLREKGVPISITHLEPKGAICAY